MLRRVVGLATGVASGGARPLLVPRARRLCEAVAEEARKAELTEFLRTVSRPIMGKAKARQSAGQKPLDLTKQLKNLDDLDLRTLLRLDGAELKRRGVPVQDRRRLLRFTDKYVQGFRHDGRQSKHSWRGFIAPYQQPDHPTYVAHTGKRPYNKHLPPVVDDAGPAAAPPEPPPPAEEVPPPADMRLRDWIAAKQAGEAETAETLRAQLRADLGIDPLRVRPSVYPEDDAPAETQARLDEWVRLRRANDYAAADALREALQAEGIEPERARPESRPRPTLPAVEGVEDGEEPPSVTGGDSSGDSWWDHGSR